MIFVPLAEIDRTSNDNYYDYAKHLTFGFKLLFFTSFVFMILNQTVIPHLVLANIPTHTFSLFQFWRLFTSPIACLEGAVGVAGLFVAFWWLLSLFPFYERKYSTVHLLIEVFFQNLTVQVIYSAVVMILVSEGWTIETYNNFFYSVGWFPLVIIWVFKYASEFSEERVNICFLPFMVKNKYLGWIISFFFIILSTQKLALVIAMLLGSLQSQLLHRSLCLAPLCLHKILECLFPKCIRDRSSFIKIKEVQQNLNLSIKSGKLSKTQLQEGEDIQQESQDMDMEEQSQFFELPMKVKQDSESQNALKAPQNTENH